MKIRERLYFGAAISIVLVIVLGVVVVLSVNQTVQKAEQHNLARAMHIAISELDIVTYEYVLHHEKRMEQQWNLRYSSMVKIMGKAEEEGKLPEAIHADYASLGDLFSQVITNYKERQELIQEGTPQERIDVTILLEERLVAQLLIISQSIITDTAKLDQKTVADLLAAQDLTRNLTLILMVLLAFAVTTSSLLVARSIVKPLAEVIKGTGIIGKGNLEHRIELKTKDEIGELAVAFKKMTEDLSEIAASRDELNKEIEMHKKAEEEFENIFKLSPDMVGVFTTEGGLIRVNPSWETILGYKTEELLKMGWAELIHPDDVEMTNKEVEKQLKGSTVVNFVNRYKCKDGSYKTLEWQASFAEEGIVHATARDITERKQSERFQQLLHRVLGISNRYTELIPMLKEYVIPIKDYTDCEAVGIRILDKEGNIPYQAYDGFSQRFYESESPLSIKSDKCMCIYVIKGETDPGAPFATEKGSFYMNGTTRFLATMSEEEKGETRNICNQEGYESVALVPVILHDETLGLIHIADRRENMVPLAKVQALEEISLHISTAIRRVRAEEAFAEEKERLEVTLRSTGDGVIATDIKGNVTVLNRVAEQLTGWTQEEAIGKPLMEIFHIVNENTRKRILNPVSTVLETGRIVGLINHAVLISRDGTERVIADSGAPIHDEQSNLFGVILVFRDISETRRLEEELQKIDKLESVGMLAGGIAHDFNNLLTGIMGYISMAKNDVEPGGKVFSRLSQAENASLRARDLTQQLLTFARGGAPIKELASIKGLIENSTLFALRGSNVRPHFSLPDDLWPVEIDEGQINQAITNIVINADEAMPEGGILHIGVKNTVIKRRSTLPLPRGNYIQITLKDNGVGISKEHLTKIFDPYFTTKQKGSGLGLATTYSIINKHDGHITVESTPITGTTFNIYLPASEKPIPAEKEAMVETRVTGTGRVLVMDDEEIIRELLYQELTDYGYEVEVTEDGAEAVERYSEAKGSGKPFDAVILDLTIPGGMGGAEAIEKLLEIDPSVKAIVSSGYSTDPVMSDFKKYGFSGIATKPYRVEELEKTLRSILKVEK